ncbi:uncharacterized protein LOC110849743 [Folsomia candida]|uniref:uncharacterized protein LOC110849743 n=1 Tax=Folsomia candida TaxID=158441 RepID=UPI000B90902F|nr:uncharacterized protein LOC110849743 [Folsomia candida]
MSSVPFTRNINPRTSSEVPILIKTGLKGNCQFQGLTCLSGQKVMVNVGVTWWDAFEIHFGVRVNPDIYTVQRQAKPGFATVKHDLREQVKQLITEFQVPKPFFIIYLVRSRKPPRPRQDDMSRPASPYIEAPQLSPATTVYREEIEKKKTDSNRKRTAAGNSGRSFAATRPMSQFEKNVRFVKSGRKHGPATNQIFSQTNEGHSRPQMMTNFHYHNERDEESDDDAGSDITSASQDSQIADLYTLGIGQEYIKSEVCNRAMSNYTNIQFLKMRNELQQFKKNTARWTKWLTRAPITSTIFRELLDV